jgi:hypothetical protein
MHEGFAMSLFIVIFSFTHGFMYAIEPSSQTYCEKEAASIVEKFKEKDPKTSYFGGCVKGGILLNIKKDDA